MKRILICLFALLLLAGCHVSSAFLAFEDGGRHGRHYHHHHREKEVKGLGVDVEDGVSQEAATQRGKNGAHYENLDLELGDVDTHRLSSAFAAVDSPQSSAGP